MPEEGRRPAVIMFTDMVGYSELTQRDERGALQLLNEHRRIVRPLLARFAGREVKTIGDAFMVEFSDGLSAVRCALEIQRQHAERNRDLQLAEIQIRIGLHAGEVIDQEGDLYGDTVNVASRIEPLAPPGGICLSEPVFEAARERIDVAPTPLGPATLKNIHLPVPVYRIDLRPERQVPIREGPWVDREGELERLEGAFEQADRGQGSVVFISGEAGVGKTRLAEQAIRIAARRGARAVRGRVNEEEAEAAYALWTEALRGLAAELSVEALRTAAGSYAEAIRPLLPHPEEAPESSAPPADPDQAQAQLYAGVTHLFRELARSGTLVLLLDDIRWADIASLRLLEAVGKDLASAGVLVIATYRAGPSSGSDVWREVVRSLVSGGNGAEIAVPRLDLPAVRQLVLLLVKTKAIPDRFVQLVYDKTRGNPFFVEEVLRSLRGHGILPGDTEEPFAHLPESLPLPDSVRRLVRRRIEELDPPVVDFLRTVAVLGPEFPLDPLERLTGLGRDPLLERLGRALALEVLTERIDERGAVRYAFSVRETWETIYGDTPATLRTRYHLRAGQTLERMAGEGRPVPAAELAHQFLQGREPGKALEYTVRAAEEAGRVYAREDAVYHYRAALELLGSRPDERLRVRVMDALSEHLFRLGQLELAQSMRREAAERYEHLGELRAAGDLHRRIAHGSREDADTARHHWEEALRLLEGGPETAELARLYSTIAGFRYEAGEAAAARELFGRAVDVARRVSDAATQVEAQMVLAGLLPLPEGARVFRELEEALKVAREHEVTGLVPNLLMVLAFAHLHLEGDRPATERALEEGIASARLAHERYLERALEGNLGTYLAWRLGQYDRALQGVEAHERYSEGDPRKQLPVAFLVAGDIALTRGDPDGAQRFIEEAGALLQVGGDWSERVQWRNCQGRADLLRRRFPRARASLHEAHELATGMGDPALMSVLHAETLHLEVETELASGDPKAAEPFLRELERMGEAAGPSPVQAYGTRALGLVKRAAGDLAGSTEAFTRSVQLWERFDWSYEIARTRLFLAGVFRQTGQSERAEPLEKEARDYLEQIRASPLGTSTASSG